MSRDAQRWRWLLAEFLNPARKMFREVKSSRSCLKFGAANVVVQDDLSALT
jgi:hypothetical protein